MPGSRGCHRSGDFRILPSTSCSTRYPFEPCGTNKPQISKLGCKNYSHLSPCGLSKPFFRCSSRAGSDLGRESELVCGALFMGVSIAQRRTRQVHLLLMYLANIEHLTVDLIYCGVDSIRLFMLRYYSMDAYIKSS